MQQWLYVSVWGGGEFRPTASGQAGVLNTRVTLRNCKSNTVCKWACGCPERCAGNHITATGRTQLFGQLPYEKAPCQCELLHFNSGFPAHFVANHYPVAAPTAISAQ